jgi:hypothetical protein
MFDLNQACKLGLTNLQLFLSSSKLSLPLSVDRFVTFLLLSPQWSPPPLAAWMFLLPASIWQAYNVFTKQVEYG